MSLAIRSWIPSLVIIAITTLFCGALYLDIQSAQNLNVEIQKSTEIRNDLQLLISELKDAETGQRGYIITGDKAFLAPYTTATTEVPQRLDNLRKDFAGDPVIQREIENIASLSKQKLDVLAETIRLCRAQDCGAAAKIVMMGYGKNIMDDLRSSVGALNNSIEISLAKERVRSERKHNPLQLIAVFLLVIFWVNTLRLERARMKVEFALRAKQESEEKIRLIFETASEGIVVWLANGRIDAANTSAARMLGHTIEQMGHETQGAPPWNAIHEDGSLVLREEHPVIITLRTGKSCRNVVMGVPHKDGSIVWLLVNSEPLFYSYESEPYAAVTTLSDITAQVGKK